MANKVILYNLTNAERAGSKRNGRVPTFVADGGYFPKANSNDSPADWDFIGVTVDGSSEEGLGAFANQAALKTYFDTYLFEGFDPEHETQFSPECLSSTAAAAYIWAKKID